MRTTLLLLMLTVVLAGSIAKAEEPPAGTPATRQATAPPSTAPSTQPANRVQSGTTATDPLATLSRSLTPVVLKYFPDAKIEITPTLYLAKLGTMAFTIHGRHMTGEISPTTHVEEGPNYKGFIIRLELREGPYRGQAIVPQELNDVYWRTWLDVVPVAERDQHLVIGFSYGNRLDEEFKAAIVKVLPTSIQMGQAP